jgi:TonB-dependent receptor
MKQSFNMFIMKELRVSRPLFFLLPFCLFITTISFGQGINTLSGVVTDKITGEELPGATIQIGNTSKGTSTDINGRFELKNIKEERVTLNITYIGYKPQQIDHDFRGGNNTLLSIELEPDATQLDQVQITGEAEGQVKAMIQQKSAANIINVVSSEQIHKFPDMNAAEVMQRIPGITLQRDQGEGRYVQLRGTPPELTNFNINGEQIPSPEGGVRYVGMDVIAADQIDFIEITKVLTPDMDGDGIGGTVNIKTKKAESTKPEIQGTLAGGYSNLRQTPNYQAQLSFGQRFGELGKLGLYVNGSYYANHYGSDNMEFKYVKGPFFGGNPDTSEDNYQVQYREFQLRHYTITRKRLGLSATLDYEFSDHSFVYLRGMFNNFSDDETRRRKIYTLEDAVTETLYLYGGIDHDVKDRIKKQNVSSINLGGEHELNGQGIKLDYEIAYSFASENEPNRLETRFENPGQAITMKVDRTDPEWPVIIFTNPENAENAYDYEHYELDQHLLEKSTVEDRNITAKINITIPYGSNPVSKGYIKFGGKTRYKAKERDITALSYGAYKLNQYYPDYGDTLKLTNVEDGFRTDDLLDHGYELEYIPGSEEMRDFYEFNAQHFVYGSKGFTESRKKSFDNDYKAFENIYAAYAMVRHDFRKLMVLGGFRYERTDTDYEAYRVVTTASGWYDTMNVLKDKRSHDFFLPQAQLKYSFNENTNLRASVTYTFARPNFDDVIPYRQEERDEIAYGNPDLEYPTSINFDLLVEKYLRGNGIISGGIFYKQIDNFIFNYVRYAHEGEPENWSLKEITTPLNGIESFVYGLEAQTQFKTTFLPGFAKDFGIYLNYTFTYSEAYIYKRYPANYSTDIIKPGEDPTDVFYDQSEREMITLPGQAKHTANLALFYESDKVYAKLAANYHDTFLYNLGGDSDLDEYYGEALHLDFNAHYTINEHFTVFMDMMNLTNAPLKFYLGDPSDERVKKKEYYSWTGRIGLKINL